MKKNKRFQQGFGLIEALLLVIAVALVIFVGYYVWHTQKQTNTTLNNATVTSQKTIPAKPSQKYLTITEWGVRMPYAGSDTYTYTFDSAAGPDLIKVVSKQMSEKYGCTDGGGGTIARLKPTDMIDAAGDLTSLYAVDHPHTLGYVKGYYYSFGHDQDACSDSVLLSAQNQANDAIKSDVPKMQSIPQ